MAANAVYQIVTDRIVSLLERGTVPWRKTWKAVDVPRSISTGKPYHGLNVWLLMGTAMVEGYSSPWWGTYKAIQEHGGQVRKGEHSTPVVFWKFLEKPDPDDPEKTRRIPMLRYYSVFNADQCDGLNMAMSGNGASADPIATAEEIFERMPQRPVVRFGGDRACYSPGLDIVTLPLRVSFESPEAFYSTAFHELTHSTGHESRLARPFNGHTFGDQDYSREELVAEMGAAFLCAQAGIERATEENTAAYLASWIKVLQGDPRMIVVAAGAAQKAADFIVGANGSGEEPGPSGIPTTRREPPCRAKRSARGISARAIVSPSATRSPSRRVPSSSK